MPRNGTGTFNLLTPYNPAVTLTPITTSWGNLTLNDVAGALTDSVAADGQTTMRGNLNLGGNKAINLAAPTLDTDAVNYGTYRLGVGVSGTWGISISGIATGILGVAGFVVGTSDTQTLTNKTYSGGVLNGVNEFSSVVTASVNAITVDASAASIFRTSTLSGTTTLTVNNMGLKLNQDGLTYTFVLISTQSASTAFVNALTITGANTTSLRWLGNVVPVFGSGSGAFDIYQFTVIRTAINTYTVLASQVRY